MFILFRIIDTIHSSNFRIKIYNPFMAHRFRRVFVLNENGHATTTRVWLNASMSAGRPKSTIRTKQRAAPSPHTPIIAQGVKLAAEKYFIPQH